MSFCRGRTNCLFYKKILMPRKKQLAGKLFYITGHWQDWQKVLGPEYKHLSKAHTQINPQENTLPLAL